MNREQRIRELARKPAERRRLKRKILKLFRQAELVAASPPKMVRRLANMKSDRRRALKNSVLAMFREAERRPKLRLIQGAAMFEKQDSWLDKNLLRRSDLRKIDGGREKLRAQLPGDERSRE